MRVKPIIHGVEKEALKKLNYYQSVAVC